jgi:lysophospholipase L1-like esterase
MKIRALKIIILLLVVLLFVSGMLNILCVHLALSYDRALQWSRLDPIGERVFAAENQKLREPESQEVRIILFGDSRIAYWTPLPSLRNCQLVNRGIAGQTTTQTLFRLNADVIRLKPAIAVLQVGINDLKVIGLWPERKNEIIHSCRENISTIINQMTEHDIRTVVLTVFPPGPVDLFRRPVWSSDIYRGVEDINQTIRELKGRGITVVDCDPILVFNDGIKPEYVLDTFHLTTAGYEALNSSLRPVLNELIQDRLKLQN